MKIIVALILLILAGCAPSGGVDIHCESDGAQFAEYWNACTGAVFGARPMTDEEVARCSAAKIELKCQ